MPCGAGASSSHGFGRCLELTGSPALHESTSEKQALQLLFIGQTSVTWTRLHALAEPIE
jgi:hypothetical protein